jgi:hypothetical protein
MWRKGARELAGVDMVRAAASLAPAPAPRKRPMSRKAAGFDMRGPRLGIRGSA